VNINERIKSAINSGVSAKSIAEKSEVGYFRIKSVTNPRSYRGVSKFDRFEEARISAALDQIKKSF
jgi:hypothetical protein